MIVAPLKRREGSRIGRSGRYGRTESASRVAQKWGLRLARSTGRSRCRLFAGQLGSGVEFVAPDGERMFSRAGGSPANHRRCSGFPPSVDTCARRAAVVPDAAPCPGPFGRSMHAYQLCAVGELRNVEPRHAGAIWWRRRHARVRQRPPQYWRKRVLAWYSGSSHDKQASVRGAMGPRRRRSKARCRQARRQCRQPGWNEVK